MQYFLFCPYHMYLTTTPPLHSCYHPTPSYITWHDMTWHDMTWHDMTWHDTMTNMLDKFLMCSALSLLSVWSCFSVVMMLCWCVAGTMIREVPGLQESATKSLLQHCKQVGWLTDWLTHSLTLSLSTLFTHRLMSFSLSMMCTSLSVTPCLCMCVSTGLLWPHGQQHHPSGPGGLPGVLLGGGLLPPRSWEWKYRGALANSSSARSDWDRVSPVGLASYWGWTQGILASS